MAASRVLCGLAWLAALAGPLWAAEPEAADRAAESAIRDLGAQDAEVRERAARTLRRLGDRARGALERASQAGAPELRARAGEVLADIRLGIGPGWPDDLAQVARDYERLGPQERSDALRRITHALEGRAAAFLARQLARGGDESARVLTWLRHIGTAEAWRAALAAAEEAKTPLPPNVAAWVQAGSGSPRAALDLLDAGEGRDGPRRDMLDAGVAGLIQEIRDRKFKDVARQAPEFIKRAEQDARFLYLMAEALVALDEPEEAEGLRKQALALNPNDEAPHYTAGEMLGQLGRRRLAALEWEAILRIPPVDEVYDLNAHLRLGSIYAACGLFELAADEHEKALEVYANRRGRGMFMIGGDEKNLRREVERLRRLAARRPAPADVAIRDEVGDNAVRVGLEARVKDGQLDELRRELGKVEATLRIQVQPRDLRLFDVAPASLRYDPQKHQIAVTLNGAPCGDPEPFAPKASPARVAIQTADCYYIFEVNAATGEAKKVARFEKDYILRLRPGLRILGCPNLTVTINGKAHGSDEVLRGVEFDMLPEAFEIVLEGTTPAGRPVRTQAKVTPEDPDIEPLREPPRPR